jgi:peptidoglycan/LPS O-acetylase OafA/YrhL
VKRQTSIYLDLIRFTAALTVFVGHTSGRRMTGGALWQVGPFMAEAVTIFFVLSGFVIAYVADGKEASARVFLVSRAARIYSVAFPALILTFSLDAVGRSINPELYNASWGYDAGHQVWQFVTNALFVNRLWFSGITPGSDLPFWSLGFEVWYYILFAMWMFLSGRRRTIAIVAGLAIVGPRIIALLPIWLIGVGCYHLSRTGRIGPRAGAVLCIGCLAAWIGYEGAALWFGRLIGFAPAWVARPELVQDYLVATLFAGHLLGFNAAAGRFTVPPRVATAIRWVAGATFSLYLFHLPVTQILTVLSPWPLDSTPSRILLFGGTLVIIFALAELTERKKEVWRTGFSRLSLRFIPAPAA